MLSYREYERTSVTARILKYSSETQIDHSTDEAGECRLTDSLEGREVGRISILVKEMSWKRQSSAY